MIKYIIDEQLPPNINIWSPSEFIHVRSIKPGMEDYEIWEYARINNLTIISKDNDFDILINNSHTPMPKLIKLEIGNMKLKDFLIFLRNDWSNIAKLSDLQADSSLRSFA